MKPQLNVINGGADELRAELNHLILQHICKRDQGAREQILEIDRKLARRGKLIDVSVDSADKPAHAEHRSPRL